MSRLGVVLWMLLVACTDGGVQDHPEVRGEGTCIGCHEREKDRDLRVSVEQWRHSVHARASVSCDGCHGGDPGDRSAKRSMSAAAGFLEDPSWREMAEYCGVCHELLAQAWTEGRFGRAMATGVRVPTCATCHMAEGHLISKAVPEDVVVAGRCRSCIDVEQPDAWKALLQAAQARERAISARVARVRGVDTRHLEVGLEKAGGEFVLGLHRFELIGTEGDLRVYQRELDRIDAAAGGLQHEATARRRYGIAMILLLTSLFVSLLMLRQRIA